MIAAMSQPSQRERDTASHRAKHFATAFLFLTACLLAASSARAANREAASREAKERAARMACLSGDYAKGVAILSELFIGTKDSTYIFNQARCFQQNARFVEAESRFEEYMRVNKKLSEEDRAETQKHISDCRASILRQSGQTATAAPIPPATTPTSSQGPAPVAPLVGPVIGDQALQTHSSASVAPGSGLRTAGVVTVAVGGVALVAGLILNLKVNSMASDFQNLNGYTDGKESDAKTFQTLGWVSYGVGAACVATGAVLYYLGVRASNSPSASVAFLPAFTPGGAFAVVKGAF
jgi:outer membrane murein-binding lipoprotein Lpp